MAAWGAAHGEPTAPPCLIEPVTGTVSIRTDAKKVYAVSATGYRLGEVQAAAANGRLTFKMQGRPQVLYYEVTD